MRCNNCGKKIKKNYDICPYCKEHIVIEHKENKNVILKRIIIGLILIVIVFFVYYNYLRPIDYEKTKKSVVLVKVYDENNQEIGSGSGVVAFENDIIITNAHVIEDNYKIKIISENNKKYDVRGIIAYNKNKDIAILKIKNSDLEPMKTQTKSRIGQRVIAIGSPLELKNIVSDGIFSGKYSDDGIDVYQHTAPISPGSSGGALVNNKGELIGITYASIEGGQNLNLAIPIDYFIDKYNNSKKNIAIETQYYKYLDSQILGSNYGSELLDYVLNDKFGNEQFNSGTQTSENQNGYLYISRNIGNSTYFLEDEFNKIKKYVDSSVYIQSYFQEISYHVDINGIVSHNENEDFNGYGILILKVNDLSKINMIKDFICNEFNYYKKPTSSDIYSNDKYVWYIFSNNYYDIDSVNDIVNKLVDNT